MTQERATLMTFIDFSIQFHRTITNIFNTSSQVTVSIKDTFCLLFRIEDCKGMPSWIVINFYFASECRCMCDAMWGEVIPCYRFCRKKEMLFPICLSLMFFFKIMINHDISPNVESRIILALPLWNSWWHVMKVCEKQSELISRHFMNDDEILSIANFNSLGMSKC